jgi:AcrR family transcriptional regulator
VPRLTRQESKERTRDRLLTEAWRLFREHGYAATSLEQIAEAAEVTKGAIYGHFDSKEDLLLGAIEAAPSPPYFVLLQDGTHSLKERLTEFGRELAEDPATVDAADAAVRLEFTASLLRNPDALRRFGENFTRRTAEVFEAGTDEKAPPDSIPFEVWAIGQALVAGLVQYRFILPEVLTPDAFGRALALLDAWVPGATADL